MQTHQYAKHGDHRIEQDQNFEMQIYNQNFEKDAKISKPLELEPISELFLFV